MEHAPYERLKWRVLRYAGALPSEKRAQEMTDADYLYCLVHEMLDREEELERLYLILENVVEEKLVDSIIYQIKSAEARYDYHYIKLRQLEQQLQAG